MSDESAGSRKPKRKRLDPQTREEEIVEGASLYFAEVGFDGSMRDLAARLGISHALLFRYFPTKDALIDRVYDRIFLSRWDPTWDGLLDDGTLPLAERLKRFYSGYLRAIDRPEWVRTFIYGGLAGININQRYLSLIKRKVIAPVAVELGKLGGTGHGGAVPSEEALELSWGLHGEVFYLAIRRWVYGVKVTTDVEGFVALTVAKFLEGAPAVLKMRSRGR
ncbi:TetR/AcrR family transcriptional regulator [Hyphomicrobium sp. LHD-15]|uniref:TetR/AcrR family transcriptional regulator n=1 Tax=Hyphomicrobium sp. LHD-15 TaxID=3072142 RepID=UPI0028101ABC|nr:TetR/AcrR family transcriptional regulator [Hyphomicrobium sp. LHD-15]MDQ8698460.1 TetR/AcrR family transcriptional regulator [Hyphomicrobium sp. LHD-15]